MTLGLPRSHRLSSRRDFLRIQQDGQRVTTAHFVLILAPGLAPDAPARLGITASKQVGNAVIRARCKRLVREVFRRDPSWVPAGVDLVAIVRTGTHQLSYTEAQAEWASVRTLLLRRANALRKR